MNEPARTDDATAAAVAALVAALGDDVVLTGDAIPERCHTDWSGHAPARPAALLRPRSTAEVSRALAICHAHGQGVVPQGGRTGMAGGAVPRPEDVVLSLERLNRIEELDAAACTMTVQAGVLLEHVQQAAAEANLLFALDLGARGSCQIGGNIAANAGGLNVLRYGPARDQVLGLEVVLADGSVLSSLRKLIKDNAGYDLRQLFVGSEGTLGVVTRAILRLVPGQQPPATVVATFPSVAVAADAVIALGRTVRASMVELMDHGSINAVEDHSPMGLNRDAGALLLIQSDAPSAARADEVAAAVAACEGAGASEVFATDDPAEGEMFVRARRLHFTALEARGHVLPEDVGVPVPQLPALLAAVAEIAERHALEIPVVAHAGDGNTHPAIIYPRGDPEAEQRARLAFDDIMAAAIALGGTITGEHGVGRLKAGSLEAQLGPDVMALNRRIKVALDPHGILNPGSFV